LYHHSELLLDVVKTNFYALGGSCPDGNPQWSGQLPTSRKHRQERACAKIGIIALADEATGFQQFRQKQALQLKLQAFIAEDLQEWARMFPDDFWYELARLEGVRYSPRFPSLATLALGKICHGVCV
jgi:hypothetical protein